MHSARDILKLPVHSEISKQLLIPVIHFEMSQKLLLHFKTYNLFRDMKNQLCPSKNSVTQVDNDMIVQVKSPTEKKGEQVKASKKHLIAIIILFSYVQKMLSSVFKQSTIYLSK